MDWLIIVMNKSINTPIANINGLSKNANAAISWLPDCEN